MSKDRIFKYSLLKPDVNLRNDEIFENGLITENFQRRQNGSAAVTRSVTVLAISLLVSVSLNIYSTGRLYRPQPDIGRSPFTGLGFDIPIAYHAYTDYWGENQSQANEKWEAIDTSPVSVALDHDWAKQHGLPEAGPFPWDESKGTYFVKAFHQLHCLKLMRRMTLDYRDGLPPVNSWHHYEHCLDALRKDIMCRADDTPMPGHPDRHLGEGQILQCRDWDKLVAWTQAPARQSCYQSLDDYREIKHSLERYAFCPEGSQYYEIQVDYFNRFGHKEVFEDGPREDIEKVRLPSSAFCSE